MFSIESFSEDPPDCFGLTALEVILFDTFSGNGMLAAIFDLGFLPEIS
jgi:hypothetical protein